MGRKMISVIIPVYNVEDYLHVCLNSILNQTYENFEIICIDDASTDSSFKILEYFSKKDSRIKILKNDSNKGPGYSRNKGLDVAKGKYVYFLDGSDWCSPDAFEKLLQKAEQDNLDMLMFKNIVYYDDSQNFVIEDYYDMEFMNKFESKVFNHFDMDKTTLFKIPADCCNKLYLKSFLDENNIRFSNENLIHTDNPFNCKVIFNAKKISLMNNYFYNKRKRSESITSHIEHIFDCIPIVHLIFDTFLENREIYEYYKKEILSYIFEEVLNTHYINLDEEYKQLFFIKIQSVYKYFIKEYGLYNDIKENIPNIILNRFKFDEIVEDLINGKFKVSIIVPVYNVEDFLIECLDSICGQKFSDIEIICVNDGSTDNSQKILNNYSKNDDRIKIINQKNCGLGCARNTGLKYANGEYIAFIDSDDYISRDYVELLYDNMILNSSDVAISKIARFENNDEIIYSMPAFPLEEIFKDVDFNKFTFNYKNIKMHILNTSFSAVIKMYKKEFLDKFNLKFPQGIAFEDVLFHVQSLLNASKISFVPEFLYYYRLSNENSIMHDKSKIQDIVKVCNSVEDFLKNSNYFEEFKSEFFIFKIIQLYQYIVLFKDDEYYCIVKKEFENLINNNAFNIEELPNDPKNKFNNVLSSNNLNELL